MSRCTEKTREECSTNPVKLRVSNCYAHLAHFLPPKAPGKLQSLRLGPRLDGKDSATRGSPVILGLTNPTPRIWHFLGDFNSPSSQRCPRGPGSLNRRRPLPRSFRQWTLVGKWSLPPSLSRQDHGRVHPLIPNCHTRGLRAAPAGLSVPPPRVKLPAEQLSRNLLQRVNDSTLKETWGFRAPPPPRPAPGTLARHPRPRRASSCPSSWSPVRVGVGPPGRIGRLQLRPLPGLPASATAEKRPRLAATDPFKCSQRETARALPAGPGGAAPAAGWLCQSPSAGSGAHVSRRHVRARPRGLRQLPLQKRVGQAGLCAPERRRRRAPHGREPRERRPLRALPPRGSARSGPRPPGAGRGRSAPGPRAGRRGVAPEPATRGARTALTRAAPRQADARRSMVGSERDEPPVLHRPQR